MTEKKDNSLIFVPSLPVTPGWVALRPEKQTWLQQHTSSLMEHRRNKGIAVVSECLELVTIKEGLKGEPMTMSNYLQSVYGKSDRTAYRMMERFSELSSLWSRKLIARFSEAGEDIMQGASGVQLKTLISVAKQKKEPKSDDPKILDMFIEKEVRPAITEIKRKPRTGERSKMAEIEAQKMACRAVIHYLRKAKLKTSAEQRHFLTPVFGWVMEAQAIHGTIRVGRMPIPDGVLAKVGRPRKQPSKAA